MKLSKRHFRRFQSNSGRVFYITAITAVTLLLAATNSTRAAPIVIGPLPYRSAADSPLDMSGLGDTFFLEDFEDNSFADSPGVIAPSVFIRGGIAADSVDADDGVLDGWGSDGLSAWGAPVFIGGSEAHIADIVFDADELGWLPTAVGFVWTDLEFLAGETSLFGFVANDPSGARIVDISLREFFIPAPQGSAANDLFFAVVDPNGISSITIGGTHLFEFDHFQYGLVVPEPTSFVLFGWATLIVLSRRRQFTRVRSFGFRGARSFDDFM